jgi:hypothetical protein
MSSVAADRAFNIEAWIELEALGFAVVESRMQNRLARAELEHIKDESVFALFKADACLYRRLVPGDGHGCRWRALNRDVPSQVPPRWTLQVESSIG